MNGVTTSALPDLSDPITPRPLQRMANALVTETVCARAGSLPDLVIGIDDLELANAAQADRVVAWVRRAVREEVVRRYPDAASQPEANRTREALRQRCSFHLLAPMIETYFFGEAEALLRAGVATEVAVHRIGADVEDFETDDPDFLPMAVLRNVEKQSLGAAWSYWREERHPKNYLAYLTARSGGLYRETGRGTGGVPALETLDWSGVTAADATLFARALFEDLCVALDVACPMGTVIQCGHTLPPRSARSETLTLRNL
jgi:hypothetical protein